ncbi:DUF7550 family protein [Natrialbaceae archaeon AArc-T1-2]|uniref:DUF7550 family protein n=1 Tax=Natrialbaceae archaeon AArc-T1-2 TaxID=3053904 RepID=UPI00255A9F4F|nr:hypothetical protein [Natrialbaceae archaeon AArc-T1-2]WIV67863.1 hypothetical protein QQ977_03785 [Natrialbaceae archaeon AArc-T1-2]
MEAETDHDSAADVGHDLEADRTTAPMSEYTVRDVAVGVVIMAIGLAVAFGVPVLIGI